MVAKPNIGEVFREMAKHFRPPKDEDVNAIYQFNLSGDGGGSWAFRVAGSECEFIEGGVENPDVSISLPVDVWIGVRQGEINSQKAFMDGMLQIGGNMNLAMQMQELFPLGGSADDDSGDESPDKIVDDSGPQDKHIFVIMPFVQSPTRDKDELDEFFNENIRKPIEEADLKHNYTVTKSASNFSILDDIIKNLWAADIVICDLSGHRANPNVMYELGIRFGVSDNPVVLIREEHRENDPIFDVGHFFTFFYNPKKYRLLTQHILDKVRGFEDGTETYKSPVLSTLQRQPDIVRSLERNRARKLLAALRSCFSSYAVSSARAAAQFISKAMESDGDKLELKEQSVDGLVDFMTYNVQRVSQFDWGSFDYVPMLAPAISTFLSEMPVEGLVIPECSSRLNEWLDQFFLEYLSSNYLWRQVDADDIRKFMRECHILAIGIEILREIVAEEWDDEMGDPYPHFFELSGKSMLLNK